MSTTADTLARLRRATLGATGLVCLAYALAALAMDRPDPFAFWLPGAFGVASAFIITLALNVTDRKSAKAATDEGYRADTHRAARVAYWIALALYPLFGVLLASGLTTFPTAFAAMGTLTGAAFLLLFTLFDWQGR